MDNLPTSQGHKGQFGGRNSPTALNAALLGMQFWDGRAADVEEQAGGPLVNPVEMANDSQEAAAAKIAKIPEYQELFKTAFPEDGAVSFKNITTALGAFERTLLTPTKWDDYLKGNVNALSEQERKGVRAFMDNGCIACHSGVNLGGATFQKFGLVEGPYWKFIEDPKHDKGRADVTKKAEDEFFFRVPGLRNVAKTYPYFHNGSVWELDKAVTIMGKAQLGKDLSKRRHRQHRCLPENPVRKCFRLRPHHARTAFVCPDGIPSEQQISSRFRVTEPVILNLCHTKRRLKKLSCFSDDVSIYGNAI